MRGEMASGSGIASLTEETFATNRRLCEHAQLWVEWASELSTVDPSLPQWALLPQLWAVASILTPRPHPEATGNTYSCHTLASGEKLACCHWLHKGPLLC